MQTCERAHLHKVKNGDIVHYLYMNIYMYIYLDT